MSNQLLNKFKVINDSRLRLKTILTNKGLDTSSNGLPSLVESVNQLEIPDYQEEEWNGVEIQPRPINYYKPEVDLDAIYNNDPDKDNYDGVWIYLLRANENPDTLPFGAVGCPYHDWTTELPSFMKFKFSDEPDNLYSVVQWTGQNYRRYTNPNHTWDESKDIIGESGIHYRWVMVFVKNTTNIRLETEWNIWAEWQNNNYNFNPDSFIIFKLPATTTSYDIRPLYRSPLYIEIKDTVETTNNLNIFAQFSDIVPNPVKTIINNCKKSFIGGRIAYNAPNLQYLCWNTDLGGNTEYSITGCKNAYIYLKTQGEIVRPLSDIQNSYIQIDYCEGLGSISSGSDYDGAFVRMKNNKIYIKKVDKIGYHPFTVRYRNDNDFQRSERNDMEIEEITTLVRSCAFCEERARGLRLKLNKISGTVEESAFRQYSNFNSLIIGDIEYLTNDAVTSPTIGNYAFDGTEITSINMRLSNIISIGTGAFRNCLNLNKIVFSPKTTTIYSQVFSGDKKLKTIVLGDGITNIAADAFFECLAENIQLSKNLLNVPNGLFEALGDLKYLGLNDLLADLGSYTFRYDMNIQYLIIPENIKIIKSRCFMESFIDVLEFKAVTTLQNYAQINCNTLIGTDKITEIGEYALNVKNGFMIPKTLTTYNSNSFANMRGPITFEKGFIPTADIYIKYGPYGINQETLNLLYTLPDLTEETQRNLYISPTANELSSNVVTMLKTKYVVETEEGLEWADEYTDNSVTVANYVANKNWILN